MSKKNARRSPSKGKSRERTGFSIPVSAEDRYAVMEMTPTAQLFPHPFTFGNLGFALENLDLKWQPLWDFRNAGNDIYNDVKDALAEAILGRPGQRVILASPTNAEEIQAVVNSIWRDPGPVVKMRPKQLPKYPLSLNVFDEDFFEETLMGIDYETSLDFLSPRYNFQETIDELGFSVDNPEEFEEYIGELVLEQEFLSGPEFTSEDPEDPTWFDYMGPTNSHRITFLSDFLRKIASNSLLTELMLVFDNDHVAVVPHHSYSLHGLETPNDNLVLVRPGRASSQYWRRFRDDIEELEMLLNKDDVLESELEALLLRNPLFLRGLNYRNVYPQVILPREGEQNLMPDMIVEPIDSEWCDIIDLKLPSAKVTVGSENRRTLAAGIHEVAAQLREYSSYFDERKLAKFVEQKYGFKCHRPRLVAIVGRDPAKFDEEQTRRAMTAYPDFEVVTYDKLLRLARNMLLL